MATNYENFSECITLPFHAVYDIQNIMHHVRGVQSGDDSQYPKLPEWVETDDLCYFDDYPPYCEYAIYNNEADESKADLYVWGDGYQSAGGLAYLLRMVLKHYDLPDKLALQVAYTCSKPRVGEFGGGVFYIDKGAVEYLGTDINPEYIPEVVDFIRQLDFRRRMQNG